MKIELEIDENLARQLNYAAYQASPSEAAEAVVARGAMNVLNRYGHMPDIVTEKHAAAMAILRDRAMERAVQCAQPGESSYNLASTAEGILIAVLDPR